MIAFLVTRVVEGLTHTNVLERGRSRVGEPDAASRRVPKVQSR